VRPRRKSPPAHRQEQILVPISGINRTEDRRIEVIVAATGRPLWVPRSIAQLYPTGRLFVPEWFHRKVFST